MIYIATVHWKDHKWIAIQEAHLAKYVGATFRKFGFLNEISEEHYASFHCVRDDQEDPTHEEKLNVLAGEIMNASRSDDDIMIFVDGDAFPIRPLVPQIKEWLDKFPLIAVQRLENLEERQPHPCFCVTTVGFWKKIGGTWSRGYKWTNALGRRVTDVGGNLLGLLTERGIEWKPLHRSNTLNYHPLLFGVYGDLVYHHGAGFRFHGNSIDYYRFGHYGLWYRVQAGILERVLPESLLKSFRLTRWHPMGRMYRKVSAQNDALHKEMYQAIVDNPEVINDLIEHRPRVEHRYDGWEALARRFNWDQ